jgi:hypothetical protein
MGTQYYNLFLNTVSGHLISYSNTAAGGIRVVGTMYYDGAGCTGNVMAPAGAGSTSYMEGEIVVYNGGYLQAHAYVAGGTNYLSYFDSSCHASGASATGMMLFSNASLSGSDVTTVSGPIRVSTL